MPQAMPYRRVQPTPAATRRTPRRQHDEQRKETERRMRRVVAWMRSFQAR